MSPWTGALGKQDKRLPPSQGLVREAPPVVLADWRNSESPREGVKRWRPCCVQGAVAQAKAWFRPNCKVAGDPEAPSREKWLRPRTVLGQSVGLCWSGKGVETLNYPSVTLTKNLVF